MVWKPVYTGIVISQVGTKYYLKLQHYNQVHDVRKGSASVKKYKFSLSSVLSNVGAGGA